MTKATKLLIAFLICITCIGIGGKAVNAKTGKTIKVKLINQKMNTDTSEAVVEIKNKKRSSISVSKVVLKKRQEEQIALKSEENWVEMKRKNKKYKIKAHATKYIDVNITGAPSGEYQIVFYMKNNGKVIKKNVRFTIDRVEKQSDKKTDNEQKEPDNKSDNAQKPQVLPGEETTDDYGCAPAPAAPKPATATILPAQTVTKENSVSESSKYYNAKQILLNGDFRIDTKGKVEAVIFSETYYKTAYKTKIDLRIQRKTRKGFKTYKRYKQIKKSNIAFLNKNFKIKKSGQYRMYVKIISYRRKNKKSIRYYKSKTVAFRK